MCISRIKSRRRGANERIQKERAAPELEPPKAACTNNCSAILAQKRRRINEKNQNKGAAAGKL